MLIEAGGIPNGARWAIAGGDGRMTVERDGPEGEQVLALQPTRSKRRADESDTVIVRAAGKGPVFAAGTMQWSWTLDELGVHSDDVGQKTVVDERMQALTRNIIHTLLRPQ